MNENVVRCNQCMTVFNEDQIVIDGNVEVCPQCNESGKLMDMEGA